VVAVPEPDAQVRLTAAPASGKPVAATPLTVCVWGVPESPPPHADKVSAVAPIAIDVSFIVGSPRG
jgi:hypothetical protein